MKEGIHPKYHEIEARCACGATWKTRSTKPELHLEICNNCHPFFTGRQKLIDTEGRVERFTKRFGAQTSESRKAAAKPRRREDRRREEDRRSPSSGCRSGRSPTRRSVQRTAARRSFLAIFRSSRASRWRIAVGSRGCRLPLASSSANERQLARAVVVPLAVLVMDRERLDGELPQRASSRRRRHAGRPRLGQFQQTAASTRRPPRSAARAAAARPAGRALPHARRLRADGSRGADGSTLARDRRSRRARRPGRARALPRSRGTRRRPPARAARRAP